MTATEAAKAALIFTLILFAAICASRLDLSEIVMAEAVVEEPTPTFTPTHTKTPTPTRTPKGTLP